MAGMDSQSTAAEWLMLALALLAAKAYVLESKLFGPEEAQKLGLVHEI
eukprot:gene37231-45939_t